MSVQARLLWGALLAAALCSLSILQACSRFPRPVLPPFGVCVPVQTFDQGGDGWYYLEPDGTRNFGLWQRGAGLSGTGALVLPPGVDMALRDAPLDLPRESVCFLGRAAGARRAIATLGWLRRGDAAACTGSGCFLTQFPPRSPCGTRAEGTGQGRPDPLRGFDLFQFPAATVQGPRCDATEVSYIAVRHEGEFVIENLGVLVAGARDCLATCRNDPECDDGNRCTADTCLAGRCRNEITCTGAPVEIPTASNLVLLLLALLLAAAAVRLLHYPR